MEYMENKKKYVDQGVSMIRFCVKIFSAILYPFNKEQRKHFREKYSERAIQNRKLRKKGILGANSYMGTGCSVADKKSRIGKYCSIANNVVIGTTMHPVHFLSTHPFSYQDIGHFTDGITLPADKKLKYDNKKTVIIGNDVWIGLNAVIMDGVTIGDGAVIGSGAIVTKDIPPYGIAVGVPAKVIKYRFPEEMIPRLLAVRWWDLPEDVIQTLPFDNVEKCLEILESLHV